MRSFLKDAFLEGSAEEGTSFLASSWHIRAYAELKPGSSTAFSNTSWMALGWWQSKRLK